MTGNGNPLIVICGSMSHYSAMLAIRNKLTARGVSTIVPENEEKQRELLDEAAFSLYKSMVSTRYFKTIRSKRVFGVLVVNEPKHGVANYIGANAFAEIAIAFNSGKSIYLFNDIPDVFRDELEAWQAIPLRGDISQLIDDVESASILFRSQGSLF